MPLALYGLFEYQLDTVNLEYIIVSLRTYRQYNKEVALQLNTAVEIYIELVVAWRGFLHINVISLSTVVSLIN